MYAIKIVNENYTGFYSADTLTYTNVKYNNLEEFYKKREEEQILYQVGDNPKEEEGWYIIMTLVKDTETRIIDTIFVMPSSIIYIMQGGKTIEIVKIN